MTNSGATRDRATSGDERGFFERAGDEISSWFGDDEAERRREMDERSGGEPRRRAIASEGRRFYGSHEIAARAIATTPRAAPTAAARPNAAR